MVGMATLKLMLILSSPLTFQIFLKVAEESGVDAETSGNPLEGTVHSLDSTFNGTIVLFLLRSSVVSFLVCILVQVEESLFCCQ
jgi:hypothetical protein